MDLSTAEEIALDSETVFETFSVIKLGIAAEVMHQVRTGRSSRSPEPGERCSLIFFGILPGKQPVKACHSGVRSYLERRAFTR